MALMQRNRGMQNPFRQPHKYAATVSWTNPTYPNHIPHNTYANHKDSLLPSRLIFFLFPTHPSFLSSQPYASIEYHLQMYQAVSWAPGMQLLKGFTGTVYKPANLLLSGSSILLLHPTIQHVQSQRNQLYLPTLLRPVDHLPPHRWHNGVHAAVFRDPLITETTQVILQPVSKSIIRLFTES